MNPPDDPTPSNPLDIPFRSADDNERRRRMEVVRTFVEASDSHIADHERLAITVLESHREFARTYFTMAGGALTLSVAMSQFLHARGTVLQPFWALAVSWICFGATMALTAGRHAVESQFRAAFGGYHRDRQWALGRIFEKLENDDHAGLSEFVSGREDGLKQETTRLGSIYDVYSKLIGGTCLVGYGLLIFFAIRSLA